jgi:DNA invertase Pin-like site-specific DNA recombinase
MSHAGVLVGYARTSTTEQRAGLEAQLRDLKATGCAKVFKEQVSSIGERMQLEAALDYVREGDTFVVTKLDRLARSARGLSELVDTLEGRGVALRILNFGGGQVDTRGAAGRLVLNVFAAFAQFELEIMKERQREGIADAKAAGKYKGRKPTARAKAADAVKLFKDGKRVSEVAKALRIGRASVYRALEHAGGGPGGVKVSPTSDRLRSRAIAARVPANR